VTGEPGNEIDEEPQEERGPKGSRDTGSDEPSSGTSGRPAGTAPKDSDTSIKPQEPSEPDAPHLHSGGN